LKVRAEEETAIVKGRNQESRIKKLNERPRPSSKMGGDVSSNGERREKRGNNIGDPSKRKTRPDGRKPVS